MLSENKRACLKLPLEVRGKLPGDSRQGREGPGQTGQQQTPQDMEHTRVSCVLPQEGQAGVQDQSVQSWAEGPLP